MRVEKDGFGGMFAFSKEGSEKPLIIPVSEINVGGALAKTITDYFYGLPNSLCIRIFFVGIMEAGNFDVGLKDTCDTLVGLIGLMQTDEGSNINEASLAVMYEESVLNFVIGKLNSVIGPHTLISQQAGHA